jgi:GT2 family glycosyltransferase
MKHKVTIGASSPFQMIPVEIIIPFNGQYSKVITLIEGIYRTVRSNKYIITLVDDFSKNAHFHSYLQKANMPNLRVLKHDVKKGFGSCVNTAIKDPYDRNINYIAVIHPDFCPKDNYWLQNLGESLLRLKSSGVKMVAPLTNDPIVDEDFLYATKLDGRKDHILDNGYLPMNCVVFHKDLFNNIGFISEDLDFGQEAEDFCVRMKLKGYKQAVCGSSILYCENKILRKSS